MQFRKVALITLKLFSNIILDTKLFPRNVNREKCHKKTGICATLTLKCIIYYCTIFPHFLSPVGTMQCVCGEKFGFGSSVMKTRMNQIRTFGMN